MTNAPDPSTYPAETEGGDEEVEVTDLSGGAVPQQLLEDGEGDVPTRR